MFMDIHCIQQVPPSNINRDDTGSPKTAYVGGALRSRVSSQAWKRAMRGVFGDMLDSSKFTSMSGRIVSSCWGRGRSSRCLVYSMWGQSRILRCRR